jgi:hypothetical protein
LHAHSIARAAPQIAARKASTARHAKPQDKSKRNWIQRHPACFGSALGFVAGFLIGFLPGDDAIFYDFDAAFNGALLGGTGAGAGAVIGWAVGRD